MVNATVESSASGVQDALADRDVVGIAALALIGAGGVFLGQEVSDQILPYLDMSPDPSDTTGLAASGLAKLVTALALGMVAMRMSGIVQPVAGVAAFGVLVSAGFDVVDMAQSGNPLGGNGSSAPSSGANANPPTTSSPTVRRASPAPAGGSTGNFR